MNKQESLKANSHLDKRERHASVQKINMRRPIDENTSDEYTEGEQEEIGDRFFVDLMKLKTSTVFDIEMVIVRQTKVKIVSDISDNPAMMRKNRSERRTKKSQIVTLGSDRVSSLIKTITIIDNI